VQVRRRRAFTLLEIMTALVILGLLYAISLSVFNETYVDSQQQAMEEQVQVALAGGLRVAGLPGNHFTFPSTTVSDIVLPAPYSITGEAADGNVLSGYVITGGTPADNELLVAGYVNGTCVLGLVTTSETMSWGTSPTDPGSCQASSFSSAIGTINGTKENPASVS
jgi:prepilin-type N-terminal cleavage/methylation domain-containing protein